jgi:hypothetical protein
LMAVISSRVCASVTANSSSSFFSISVLGITA